MLKTTTTRKIGRLVLSMIVNNIGEKRGEMEITAGGWKTPRADTVKTEEAAMPMTQILKITTAMETMITVTAEVIEDVASGPHGQPRLPRTLPHSCENLSAKVLRAPQTPLRTLPGPLCVQR
jgi:hypothetical protein